MKSLYTKLYAIAFLIVGSAIHADSTTPYTITVINNTNNKINNVRLESRNTHKKKKSVKTNPEQSGMAGGIEKGETWSVLLTQDLRLFKFYNTMLRAGEMAQMEIKDNLNGTSKFRRGALIFIYKGVIPNSSDTTYYPQSIIVCQPGTVQPDNYKLNPNEAIRLGGIQYTKSVN
ncbi:MAG: hypothetical protein Q8Q60_01150 [Candidatus Chromulinivorax sp.]|nr:hypothetical protein [Candidatus Chromulinivorax sp.]